VLVGIVASPCHSAFTLPNALAPTFPLVGAFLFLTRQFHEWPAATADVTVLPSVLGCSFDFAQDRLPLRRTVQVRLGSNPPAIGWWHSHLHGLATAIHEIAGFGLQNEDFRFRPEFNDFRKQSKIFCSIIHSDVNLRCQVLDSLSVFPDT
jgi:hypothetical protein